MTQNRSLPTFTATLAILIATCNMPTSALADEGLFRRWDNNNDQRLEKNELPAGPRANFERADRNNDGFVTLAEHLAFFRPSPQSAQTKLPDGAIMHRDLPYVEQGHPRQKLDLYLPKPKDGGRPTPLVIWIHGGAWKGGNKKQVPRLTQLLSKNFAVASINYRLSQHAIFPAQIHDCKAAVRFLRKQSKTYNLNEKRFGAWGASAGGHLVAMLGTTADVKSLEGTIGTVGVSSRVHAVCDWFGPTDLLKMNEQSRADSIIDHDATNSPESLLIGGAIQDNAAKTRLANPINYVTSDDATFLIMHGNLDRLVPWQQSQALHRKLIQKKVASKLIIVDGAGHGFRSAQERKLPIDFFVKTLKSQAASPTSD